MARPTPSSPPLAGADPGRAIPPTPTAGRIYLAAASAVSAALGTAWFVPLASDLPRLALGVAAGLTAFAAVVPWPQAEAARARRRGVDRLIARAEHFLRSGDRDRLPDPDAEVDAQFVRLARVLDTLGRQVDAEYRRHRHLERTLDHKVDRQTRKATAELHREATTDPLTGLGNRRRLDEALAHFFGDGGRRRDDLVACIAIDLDHFKRVNDVLGHGVGDECLAFVGDLLRSTLRGQDVAVRLGGDEFVILLPSLGEGDVASVATRITELHARRPWPHEKAPPPTISAGVAVVSASSPEGAADLLARADTALYAAKKAGRDGVACWSDVPPERRSA